MPAPVTIITGAGSGIGRACAAMLAELGHRLVLVGRRQRPLLETASACPPGSITLAIEADIASPHAPAAIVDAAVAHYGSLNVLINNAGLARLADIDAHSPEMLDELYQANALGPARLIARAWAHFKRQHAAAAQAWGCIVNVSTMGSIDPFPGFFGYAAAKSATNTMARSCATEGRDINVRAFAVAPGAVETPMLRGLFDAAAIPPSRTLTPEDVARIVVECVEGRRNHQNGETILVPSP